MFLANNFVLLSLYFGILERATDTIDKQSLHCLYSYYPSFPYFLLESSLILGGILS